MNVVALGGGTGLPVVLTALRRNLPASGGVTAIVTAADDGGSSGVLRRQYGVLPPGDIRNCLIALARVAPEVSAACRTAGPGSRRSARTITGGSPGSAKSGSTGLAPSAAYWLRTLGGIGVVLTTT